MKPGERYKHENGKTYEAVERKRGDMCDKCIALISWDLCYSLPPCKEVIFKEVEPQKTETDDTQTSD